MSADAGFPDWWARCNASWRRRGNSGDVPEAAARHIHSLGFSPSEAATIVTERGIESVLADAKREAQ